MTRPPDALLALLLLAPALVAGVVATVLLWPEWRPRRRRRLTNAEVRRMYRIIAERAGKFQRH